MTFREALRHPPSLVITLVVALLMMAAPSYSFFAFGAGNEQLRGSLLSTHMLSGVVLISLTATSLFYREMSEHTILAVLSKPVSLPVYYCGKLLGILALLTLFYFIITCTGVMSTIISVMETASTRLNLLPLYFLSAGLLALAIFSFLANYLFAVPIVSCFFLGWGLLCPLVLLATWWLSPLFEPPFPLPEANVLGEYLKSALALFGLIAAAAAFSVALSACTGPAANLVLSVGFLIAGLMAPGLEKTWQGAHPWLAQAAGGAPNLHAFWLAEMVDLGQIIPWAYVLECLGYAALLAAGFSCAGIFVLLGKEYT